MLDQSFAFRLTVGDRRLLLKLAAREDRDASYVLRRLIRREAANTTTQRRRGATPGQGAKVDSEERGTAAYNPTGTASAD